MASLQRRGQNSWLLVVEVGNGPNGKRIKKTKTIKADGVREARKRLAQFETEVEAGEYISPQKMTMVTFVQEWRSKVKKDLSPLTYKTNNHHINNHILPVLGHLRLDQINTMHLVRLIDNLSKPGMRKDRREGLLSDRTVSYIYRVLQNLFKHAKDWQLLKKNPMDGTKKPKVEKKEMLFYDADEAKQAIQALNLEPKKWKLFCLGAIIGGFRRGELLALEWKDVNFTNNKISIVKSKSLTENGVAIVKKPKTVSSIRDVDMPNWFMDELKSYQISWNDEWELAGDKRFSEDHQYVFHSGLGKPIYHTTPAQWWTRFVRRHDLKFIRFHDLRHSSATLLIEAETDLKSIQQRLGHGQMQTTMNIYGHVTQKLSRKTADKFDQFDPRKINTLI
jgi:integrase